MSLRYQEVAPYLTTRCLGRTGYHWAEEMASTNAVARSMTDARHGCVVICERQTAGRGRMDRVWESMPGQDLTLSVILRLEDVRIAPLMPLAVSLAGANALSELGAASVIKWPNDLLLGGKKTAGILCSLAGSMLVAGIGINVNRTDFPRELADRATSLRLEGLDVSLPKLAGVFLNRMEESADLLASLGPEAFLEAYRPLCVTLGQRVRVLESTGEWTGTALDLTAEGGLVVKDACGAIRTVYAGDVSVRGMMGYADQTEEMQ